VEPELSGTAAMPRADWPPHASETP
jgi:hypothetical protein